jgi:uncharacterized membrane protein YczE
MDEKRGDFIRSFILRVPSLIFGLILYYLGFVFILKSGLGMYPGGVFTVGVALNTPFSIGQINQIVQGLFLLFGWYLGFAPGLGTLADLILSGIFIDLFINTGIIQTPISTANQFIFLMLGVGLMGAGTFFYIKVLLGAGPLDGFMLGVSRKIKRPVFLVRSSIEIILLTIGWVLDGPVGVGTIITALTIGTSIQLAFKMGGYDQDSQHINLYELLIALDNK